jgi:outer membrane protein TolC
MKKIILIGLSTCFCIVLNAQEKTMTLSLQEAINFALENSYNAKAAKNDIRSAKETVWETTAIGLPQVNAAIDYQNFLKQPVSLLPAAAFDNRESIVETVEEFF